MKNLLYGLYDEVSDGNKPLRLVKFPYPIQSKLGLDLL
jgi:hypothetical protein